MTEDIKTQAAVASLSTCLNYILYDNDLSREITVSVMDFWISGWWGLVAPWENKVVLVCDEHLNHKDAEEDEGGTANVVLEHGQVQGSVLQRRKEHTTEPLARTVF